jgi:PIN like domain
MPARPVAVRIYFDADVLGLAKLLCRERADFAYPGDLGGRIKKRQRPACPISSPATKDTDWIPRVAAEGWLIITRDRHIQENRAEINAVRQHRAKMLNLASEDAGSTWGQLEIFMARWRDIDSLTNQAGPFIYVTSRTGRMRPIDLH